jgi:4-amino-4-deoxychorismate lyase
MTFYYRSEFRRGGIEIAPHELHFRCGLGFFARLFHNGHMLRHLDAHLARLYQSLEAFQLPYRKAPMADIIDELLRENGLFECPARVEIFYPVVDLAEAAEPLITVAKHEVQPDACYELGVFPWPHQSFLNQYGSMSAMHAPLAQRFAQEQGFDDVVLTDTSGTVLEAAAASLLFSDGRSYVAPRSTYTVRRVAMDRAVSVLPVREEPLRVSSLGGFSHAFLLNAVIGMRPVLRIGDMRFEADEAACELATLAIL